jgi:hypothetical protein
MRNRPRHPHINVSQRNPHMTAHNSDRQALPYAADADKITFHRINALQMGKEAAALGKTSTGRCMRHQP